MKVLFVSFALLAAGTSVAEARCIVTDPTGTPLNIRSTPNGPIVGTLRNGASVEIVSIVYDTSGRPWANIGLGWVFRDYVTCN